MAERARVLLGVVIAASVLAGCAARKPQRVSVEQYDAIRARLEAMAAGQVEGADQGQSAGQAQAADRPPADRGQSVQAELAGASAGPSELAGASAGPSEPATADAPVLPPRDDAERRRRAAAALPPNVTLDRVVAVGDGTRWVVALATPAARAGSGGRANLVLLDVARPTGVVLGEHDFGFPQGDAGVPVRTTLGKALLVDATPGAPVILAEVLESAADGAESVAACGWSLARRRWAFVCAPRTTPTSRWDVLRGELVETWTVDSVGVRFASEAGSHSGRVLRWSDSVWRETDAFRCLGQPLAEAFREAGGQPLQTWQHATVRRLTLAARRASASLETDTAIARLRDALAVDGCAPEVWRILGRLEFEAGRPDAVATLAVALALAPRDAAALIDLADALAVLDLRRPGARDRWHTALAVLESRRTTRRFVEGAGGKSPRGLAIALYSAYLARTSPTDEWLAARRRKVEEKIDRLERMPAES